MEIMQHSIANEFVQNNTEFVWHLQVEVIIQKEVTWCSLPACGVHSVPIRRVAYGKLRIYEYECDPFLS